MTHPDYHLIGQRFRHRTAWSDDIPLEFRQEGVDLYHLSYTSRNAHFLLGQPSYHCPEHGLTFPGETTEQLPVDAVIEENIRFRYPLVREHRASGAPLRPHSRAIIVMHGLNERSFSKYIPWAYHLRAMAGTPVLLFPLTFHINRVRREWGMNQQASFAERLRLEGNENPHRFNAVISERIGTHPERFFWGAVQSYWDIVDLVTDIREGRHPHFAADARVDLVAYSAGGYVALNLLLQNPRGLFSDSRGAFFATCAAMRDTNLSSHLILDLMSEIALMKLYVKYRAKLTNDRLRHWFEEHPEGLGLNAFCGLMPDRTSLDAQLKKLAPRLLGIANTNDQVMTPGAMLNALQGVRRVTGVRVEELSMGIHENPFACPDYDQRDRTVITNFLDIDRYGEVFEKFITMIVKHFC